MKRDVRQIITIICAKGFLDLNFNEAAIDKISNFHEIAPNFTYYKNRIV